ncbi:MAG: dockerin type I repeat-containing protein [Candidatus Binatia bacterium]
MGLIVVEAKPGGSGAAVGQRLVVPPALPGGRPDLQIEATNVLGNGNPAVCAQPTANDGIPKTDPPDFGPSTGISDRLRDFACRFEPFALSTPCTLDGNGLPAVGDSTAAPTQQFCSTKLSFGQALPLGDTVLTVQVRDVNQHVGPTAQIVVRVVTPARQAPTPTPSGRFAMSGQIRYFGNAEPVDNVTVNLQGPTPAVVQSSSTGQFAFSDLTSASWQLLPAKVGGAHNSITALDAVFVLQAVVGLRILSPAQRLACDVSGNGGLSALDAVRILQYVVGLIPRFPAAQRCGSDWAFIPVPGPAPNQFLVQPLLALNTCQQGAVAFEPLAGQANHQDFVAAFFGDCSGNWQPGGG